MHRAGLDWTPLGVDSDPVPGDPELVQRVGRHYERVALAINGAATKLRTISGDNQIMHSAAVDAFRRKAEEVAEKIDRAYERYEAAGQAMSGYAPELDTAQSESVQALHQAREAQAAQHQAQQLMGAAQDRMDAAPPGADTTEDLGAYKRAAGSWDEANAALAAARERMRRAVELRDNAAERASAGVRAVVEDAELNDNFWDNWGAKIVDWVGKIADWVAVAAGVLALVFAWFPPVAAALATVALIASAVSLAMKTIQAATGEGTWGEAAWAALGVASFGVGRAAVAGLRGSVKGLQAARSMARATGRTPHPHLTTFRTARKASARHGLKSSLRAGMRDLRKVPGELTGFKELRNVGRYTGNIRSADYTGFRAAADEIQTAKPLFDESIAAGGVVRSEGLRHMARGEFQFGVNWGATAFDRYQHYASVRDIIHPPAPASEQLNLPNDQPSARAAGAPAGR